MHHQTTVSHRREMTARQSTLGMDLTTLTTLSTGNRPTNGS